MIAEVKITGNRKFYSSTRLTDYIEVKLTGDFAWNANTPVYCNYGNVQFPFDNRQHLFKFSEEVRGASFNKLILLLLNRGASIPFENKDVESGLLKAIFLIYHWIEMPLASPKDLKLEDKIYDEFIVDWTDQPEPQRDIYFINKKYSSHEYETRLNKLIDLNLLAKLEIVMANQFFTGFFIPLFKPGIGKDLFASANDVRGEKTYGLWKQILNERDIRISRWANNRF